MEPFTAIMVAFGMFVGMCLVLHACKSKNKNKAWCKQTNPDVAENGPLTASGKGFDYNNLEHH